MAEITSKNFGQVNDNRRSKNWRKTMGVHGAQLDREYGVNRPMLPICPYGCGEEGQFREVVMEEDGNAVGVFQDSDGCIFTADIQVSEPPAKRKLMIGPDGELKEVGE
jgi:hypothetical protein